jgi:hypothetical protein
MALLQIMNVGSFGWSPVRRVFSAALGLFVTAAALTACSPQRMVIQELSATVAAGLSAMEADDDLETTERALPAQIKLLEGLLASAPQDENLQLLLARLLGGYTFTFLDARLDDGTPSAIVSGLDAEELVQWADRLNRKGAAYARLILVQRHPKWAEVGTSLPEELLQEIDRPDAPALFWFAFHLGSQARRHPDSAVGLAQSLMAHRAMERVIALTPDYQDGAAHLLLMVAAARPPMLGGDPAQAEAHYRRLKAVAGDDYRMADLFYARYCLHPRQDRVAFVKTLQAILAQPVQPSRHGLQNAAAARRAKRYLERIDQWFE